MTQVTLIATSNKELLTSWFGDIFFLGPLDRGRDTRSEGMNQAFPKGNFRDHQLSEKLHSLAFHVPSVTFGGGRIMVGGLTVTLNAPAYLETLWERTGLVRKNWTGLS